MLFVLLVVVNLLNFRILLFLLVCLFVCLFVCFTVLPPFYLPPRIIIVIYRKNHPPFPLNCYLYA